MDMQVLEATNKRIEILADGVDNVLKRISGRTTRARQHLGPLAQRTRGFEQYKDNAQAVLEAMDELKGYSATIEADAKVIEKGPGKVGLDEYTRAQHSLQSTIDHISGSEYRKFKGLTDRARSLQRMAISGLRNHTVDVLNKTYPPPTASEYFFAGKSVPPFEAEKLARLRQAVDAYDNAGQSDEIDKVLTAAYAEYVRLALAEPSQKLGSNEQLKAYMGYMGEISDNLIASTAILFQGQPERQKRMQALITQAVKTEHNKVTQGVASSSDRKDSLAVFDSVESAVMLQASEDDLSPLRAAGLEQLKAAYSTLDHTSKQGKVEGEASIAGATATALSSLRGISKRHNGVKLTLASFPERAYLPSPPPDWVSKFPYPPNSDPAAVFIADCLEALDVNLSAAAKSAGLKPQQQGMFLLLNLATVEHYIESNHLGQSVGSVAMDRLKKHTKQAFKLYLTDWQRVSQHLLDQTITASKPGSKLSSKDRDAIKDRFRLFNSEFEGLVERQKRYNIPDIVLRKRIALEISQMIKPLYKRFYDRHSGGDFTKNVEKYIKYDLKQMDETLASLAK